MIPMRLKLSFSLIGDTVGVGVGGGGVKAPVDMDRMLACLHFATLDGHTDIFRSTCEVNITPPSPKVKRYKSVSSYLQGVFTLTSQTSHMILKLSCRSFYPVQFHLLILNRKEGEGGYNRIQF